MIIAVDFDDCVASYVDGVLTLRPGARRGLLSLKAAGHVLLLFSSRTNRAQLHLSEFDPLVRSGHTVSAQTDETRAEWARLDKEMRSFCEVHLPGVFDAIDDGRQGCPCVDLWVSATCVQVVGSTGWQSLAALYGE